MIPRERHIPLAEARTRIEAELGQLAVQCTLRQHGSILPTSVATLTCPRGKTTTGVGKGRPEAADTGAMYEALEHYLSEQPVIDAEQAVMRVDQVIQAAALRDDDIVQKLATQGDALVATRHFHSERGDFAYPLALCNPWYAANPVSHDTADYRALRRYSSNSGIAIGANLDEAILHGANECIERDALSIFLSRRFHAQNDSPLPVVDHEDLASSTQDIWLDAQNELQASITVVDISTEFLPRSYLAFADIDSVPALLTGSGASLDAQLAVERAITELVQLHAVTAHYPTVTYDQLKAHANLAGFPRLGRCFLADVRALVKTCGTIAAKVPASPPVSDLPTQIRTIADDLALHGFTLAHHRMYQGSTGIALANVLIPGLERFFVVSSGNIVVPHRRGRAAMTASV
jgi:ribosomal protein S12 methylthiotransferase accessory factor